VAILPVKRGISSPAVTNIPKEWDSQWFRYFIDNFLTGADIRNVVTPTGSGIAISGNVSGNATTGSSTTVTISQSPIPNDTVMGNVSGSTATPVALSQAQLTSIVNLFTSSLSGTVPGSGGGTANFLRADGTWNIPAGSAAIANDTVLGNISGSTATPVALTQTQLTTLINIFTATLSGAVPASAGGTTTFLRADASFAVPPTFTSGAAGYVPASGGGTTNFLRADGTFAVPSSATGANPSTQVDLSTHNGSALTFMRSDAAPSLSQAISPVWTSNHIFQNTVGIPVVIDSTGTGGNRALSLAFSSGTFSATGNPSMTIANSSAAAQTPIDFFSNLNTFTGRIRNDFAGNMAYVSLLSGIHTFLVGGDSGVGVDSFDVKSGKINLANHTTTTTAPAAGGAGALPATPKGYVTIQVKGTDQQMAYY
jgi:hypothetical protein